MDFGFGGLVNNALEGGSLRQIADNQIQLLKMLDYMQSNLGADNFNQVEWGNLTEPIYAKITAHDSVLGELSSELSVEAGRIAAMVQAVGADGEVTAASIVAAINATTGESIVKIAAEHIDITGEVQFLTPDDVTEFVSGDDLSTLGATIINGGNISTGNLNATRISGGTLNCSLITVANLSASSINSGTMSAARISGGTITASDILGVNITGCNITSTYGGYEIELSDGAIQFSNSGTSGYGRIRYDDSSSRFNLYSSTIMKLIAGDNLSIDAGSGDTLYLGTTNDQTVRIGRVGEEVRIYGTLYVNDQAMTVP